MHLHIAALQTFVEFCPAVVMCCVPALLWASVVEARSDAGEAITYVLHSWEPLMEARGDTDAHANEPLVEAGKTVRVVVSLVFFFLLMIAEAHNQNDR